MTEEQIKSEGEEDCCSTECCADTPQGDESSVSKVTELEGEVAELNDKYLRAVAELENFKKRSIKERSELVKYSGESLARDLLEVVDNLERAQDHTEHKNLIEGLSLVLNGFKSVLAKHSINSESALGSEFDPEKHEALSIVASKDAAPNQVIEEFKKAYFLKDKLIRPAQVVVSEEKAGS